MAVFYVTPLPYRASRPKGSSVMWTMAKRIKNTSSSAIPTLILNDNPIVTSLDKASLLASQFATNSTLHPSDILPHMLPHVNHSMGQIYFRTHVIAKVVKNLNFRNDVVSVRSLQARSFSLAKPLRKPFYLSYSLGIFPTRWKLALVQPVQKKGDAFFPSSYSPIVLTSILSKVMETIINRQLLNYFDENKLLNDRQYGFRGERSTGDLTTYLSERWNECVHHLGETKVVALTFQRRSI